MATMILNHTPLYLIIENVTKTTISIMIKNGLLDPGPKVLGICPRTKLKRNRKKFCNKL